MPSTPSPGGRRLRTPPAPGPGSDIFEPYSPRRSKRSTAANNPYSSFNSETSPSQLSLQQNVTPPTAAKKARFAGPSTQLTSPPSSPASPARNRVHHKTPGRNSRPTTDTAQSKASISLTTTPSNMLPTPLKTPKQRHHASLSSTSRVLNFRPDHLNDIMPTARDKVKRHAVPRKSNGFDLYDEQRARDIPIFTDSSARVPEMDNSEENPFVGAKKAPSKQRKSSRRSNDSEKERIKEAVRNDEGIEYMHRGKSVFRKFQDSDDGSVSSSSVDLSMRQRQAKRAAGDAATRPLTRSAIKPRLLWPSKEQELDRERKANEIDEEAMTDIEVPEPSSAKEKVASGNSMQATPPTTIRTTRSHKFDEDALDSTLSSFAQDDGDMAMETPSGVMIATSSKKSNPFDAWPRTKAGRKRAGESAEVGAGGSKRTRKVD